MNKAGIIVYLALVAGCATTGSDSNSGDILSGKQLASMVRGNTLVYHDRHKTREYFHPNGIVYTYYQTDEDYHNQRWCMKAGKLCIDSKGVALSCPKVKRLADGSLRYDGSRSAKFKASKAEAVTIRKGDPFKIKRAYDKNGWNIHTTRHCR
jgi:hypothetical protein